MFKRVVAQFSKLFDPAVPVGFVLLLLFGLSGCGGGSQDLPPIPGYLEADTVYFEAAPVAQPVPATEVAAAVPVQPAAITPEDGDYEKLQRRLEKERRRQEKERERQEKEREREERRAREAVAAAAARYEAQQKEERVKPLPQTPPPSPAGRRNAPEPPTMGPTPEEVARAREINENKPTHARSDLFSTSHNLQLLEGDTEATLLERYGEPDSIFTYPEPRQFYRMWKHPTSRPPEVRRFARVKEYLYQERATRVFFYMERQDSGEWEILTVIRDIPPGG